MTVTSIMSTYSVATANSVQWTDPGTYSFTVPYGVKVINAVVIGAGGSAGSSNTTQVGGAGGGGALVWINGLNVGEGTIVTVGVGTGGPVRLFNSVTAGAVGSNSYIQYGGVNVAVAVGGGGGAVAGVTAAGGLGGAAASCTTSGLGSAFSGGNGGAGGTGGGTRGGGGGGGAAGYAGNGGDGSATFVPVAPIANSGSGSGGVAMPGTGSGGGSGGGGTGLYGSGPTGNLATITAPPALQAGGFGYGGSAGLDGYRTFGTAGSGGRGGTPGGGGGSGNISTNSNSAPGGSGGVRIFWNQIGSLPATNVGVEPSETNGALLFSSDGTSLAGWTNSNVVINPTEGSATAGSFQVSAGPSYAYISPPGIYTMVNKTVTFNVKMQTGTPLCNFMIGTTPAGFGNMLRIEGRPVTTGYTGLAFVPQWASGWNAPVLVQGNTTVGVWHTVKINISRTSVANVFIDGSLYQSNIGILLPGTTIAVHGDGGSGAFFDDIKIFDGQI